MAHDEALIRASELVAKVRDVVDERAGGDAPPGWCTRRGWADFLAELSDADVDGVERDGLARAIPRLHGAPDDLATLAVDVAAVTALPPPATADAPAVELRGASLRKRSQVAQLGALLAARARTPKRIIDVGSGHGHLTRHLAASISAPVVGWERDAARVRVADRGAGAGGPSFVVADVEALAHTLRGGDLVVGLHACGALGDLMVQSAGRAGADVALVACCLQKRPGARDALCAIDGVPPSALRLGHDVLGLANARNGQQGIEDDLATRSRSRLQRVALRLLLASRGEEVEPGAEMKGVNRRRATGTLASLVLAAFAARGLPSPTANEVEAAALEATRVYGRARRWELPRTMLARLIEVWVARDRAGWLERLGYETNVREVFDEHESPRNVLVLASR